MSEISNLLLEAANALNEDAENRYVQRKFQEKEAARKEYEALKSKYEKFQ